MVDESNDRVLLSRINTPEGPKEYMGSCVEGLGAGLRDETLGGRARPVGVEHGGQRGIQLKVVRQGRLGA